MSSVIKIDTAVEKNLTNTRKSVSVVLLEKGVPNTELSVHMIPD